MNRLPHTLALALAATVALPGASGASPVTYAFTGALEQPVGGTAAVTGTFTYDASTETVLSASFSAMGTTFGDPGNAFTVTEAGTGDRFLFLNWLGFINPINYRLDLVFDASVTRFETRPIVITFDDTLQSSGSTGTASGVTGNSVFASGTVTAVPAPVSVTLLGVGLLGLALARRRG